MSMPLDAFQTYTLHGCLQVKSVCDNYSCSQPLICNGRSDGEKGLRIFQLPNSPPSAGWEVIFYSKVEVSAALQQGWPFYCVLWCYISILRREVSRTLTMYHSGFIRHLSLVFSLVSLLIRWLTDDSHRRGMVRGFSGSVEGSWFWRQFLEVRLPIDGTLQTQVGNYSPLVHHVWLLRFRCIMEELCWQRVMLELTELFVFIWKIVYILNVAPDKHQGLNCWYAFRFLWIYKYACSLQDNV